MSGPTGGGPDATERVVTSHTASVAGIMTALLAACFAFQLNASMLSPALALMETQLGATTAEIGLTQTAFFTSAALFSLFLPRLGDMMGRRKLLAAMMLGTAVGCVISALAPNVGVLFAGRVIQGIAGPTVPLCLIMLRVAVTDAKKYGTLMGVVTAVNGGIAGVDAIAGGWLAQNYGFRSIFWVMAVVAVIAFAAVRFLTDESRVGNPQPMDWRGVALLVVAVGCVLTAFNEMGKLAAAPWGLITILIVVGVVTFGVFWKSQDASPHPLIPTEYLRARQTWALLGTTVLTMTGVFAVMNGIVPALAQDMEVGAGMNADVAALFTLTPYALAGLFMGPVAGRLAGTHGYRAVLRVGLIGTVIGLAAILLAVDNPSRMMLLAVSVFVGITYAGMSNIMLNGLGIVLSPADSPGYLPGLNAGAFNLGAGLSFAALFAAQTALGASDPVAGYRGAILVGAAILALAFLMSLLIPRPKDEVAEAAEAAASA